MTKNKEEQIKNRMINKAAALWGVPAKEIETSFDPVVSLLLNACAYEIEKISDKVNESQTKITEKIIQLMTPDTIFGAKSSHGIVHVDAAIDQIDISSDFIFTFKKKMVEKANLGFKDIFFSPIQKFKAIQGEIEYLAIENSIHKIDAKKNNESLFQGNEAFLNQSELYLGINISSEDISLKNVSFYFELQDFDNTKLFYHHLKDAKWYINEKEVKTKPGLYNSKSDQEIIIDTILDEDSIKVGNIIDNVKNNYSRHYITITEDIGFERKIPEELEDVIAKNRIKIENNTLWIKVIFPRVINNNVLKNIHCSLNSFPVINRKKEEFSYKLKEFINIVPIEVTDLFLDIKSITNLDGKQYKLLNKNVSSNEKGIYSLKTDSIAKLDNRKAKDYVHHLISLLKDESASFSFLKNDFLHNNLKTLNQLVSLLETKMSEISNNDRETKYVSITPYLPKDTLTVEYWTTNGSEGNNIKYGSALKVYKGVGLKQKESFFVSSTYGGRNELSMNERLQTYRRSLLSRDRIVTKEDVKASCFEFLGNKIIDVTIKNGYTVDISLSKGLLNCIEIILTLNDDEDFDSFEWDFLKNNLLSYLEKHSINVFPYIIKIKK
ncbi:hypothetical protein OAT18_00045 [Tenacibaculum sp.]|nr:hypothetical protein [Tenacibaculum sp.]